MKLLIKFLDLYNYILKICINIYKKEINNSLLNHYADELFTFENSNESNLFLLSFRIFITTFINTLILLAKFLTFIFMTIKDILLTFLCLILFIFKSILFLFFKKELNFYKNKIIINDYEKYLNSELKKKGKYYLVSYPYTSISIKSSLSDFIFSFFNDLNMRYDTYSSKDTTLVCRTFSNRSLRDLYLICKYYYPNCTPKDILENVFDLVLERNIYGQYCHSTSMYVFNKVIHGHFSNHLLGRKTEYGDFSIRDLINAYIDEGLIKKQKFKI